jgi:hypothetical protein
MTDADTLFDAVRAKAEGTPYVVERTDTGFDVRLDLADARWFDLMHKRGLRTAYTHHVRLDEAEHALTITDDMRSVEWRAGGDVGHGGVRPVVAAQAQRAMGRFHEVSFRKEYGLSEDGHLGEVVSYSFSSKEGLTLVREPAKELGWTEHMPAAAKVGLVFGIIGGVGGLAAVVVVLVFLALGKF